MPETGTLIKSSPGPRRQGFYLPARRRAKTYGARQYSFWAKRYYYRAPALLALAVIVPLSAFAQDLTPPTPSPAPGINQSARGTNQPASTPAPEPKPATAPQPTPAPQAVSSAIDQLTQSNRDLLDLLKKQQGVLEDMQYDRRLQSRQIENLEVRLTEALQQNADLQAKVAKLETQLTAPPPSAPAATPSPTTAPTAVLPAPPPSPPASYLPPAPPEGPPGAPSWHRIYTLSGNDNETSDPIHIDGVSWRVVWHNQDKEGAVYKNTSALFINAFAKGDTIPQKVCSKLGSGGDSSDLTGPGDFVLKIEASGGKWELAVEDLH
ncbi:MAG: hypothetical protein LV481_11055 [Methylacidiphilales bacterium]|nr:hypothetical protein [Candidatus Methylacidiphilales bacterium]